MRDLATVSAITLMLAGPAAAQIGNPAGAEPGMPEPSSGMPSPVQRNSTDRLFAQLIAIGGMAEVEAGKTARDKAQAGTVKEFARRMVQDHSKANDELMSWAKGANVQMPDKLDDAHKSMQADLEQANGSQLDLAYMRGQVEDHQKAVQLLEWEIDSGQNAALQRLASRVLPIVLTHLEMAQRVLASLTGQGLPSSDAGRAGSVSPARDTTERSR